MDTEANLRAFMADRTPHGRYASFDYCFNYFQAYREAGCTAEIAAPANLELSCLQLGFYLASWGMFRGSSAMLRRSARQFQPLIELIAAMPAITWDIDADSYTDPVCDHIMTTVSQIRRSLQFPGNAYPTPTLITKIMLGVFGNVPAFDTRVVAGLRANGLPGQLSTRSLLAIGRFYRDHHEVIELNRRPTLDFSTGTHTCRGYTRAKVIDQIFFIEGRGTPLD